MYKPLLRSPQHGGGAGSRLRNDQPRKLSEMILRKDAAAHRIEPETSDEMRRLDDLLNKRLELREVDCVQATHLHPSDQIPSKVSSEKTQPAIDTGSQHAR